MTNETRSDLFQQTIIETLEEAAFIFATPAKEVLSWSKDKVLEARLSYTGEATGTLMMAATTDSIAEIAANMLGLEPDEPDVEMKQADALGEMLNIIGGVVVEAWFGSESEVQLDVPRLRTLAVDEYERQLEQPKVSLTFETEEGERIDAAVFA
ncbi:MAG: chemotaxis protein CheX [Deltaproteobacteria bacterium]|nr:chemotaxis protein CheX [Deltaproteobacteria bacterium]